MIHLPMDRLYPEDAYGDRFRLVRILCQTLLANIYKYSGTELHYDGEILPVSP